MGFQKGRVKTGGRRRGSLNKASFVIQEACREQGPMMIARLVKLVKDEDCDVSIKAIKILLAYGFGRPPESIELGGAGSDAPSSQIVFYMPDNQRHNNLDVSKKMGGVGS